MAPIFHSIPFSEDTFAGAVGLIKHERLSKIFSTIRRRKLRDCDLCDAESVLLKSKPIFNLINNSKYAPKTLFL